MNRKILQLAVPNIISNISVPLLSMIDLSLMGHLETEAHINAIALGGMIFNFIYWGLAFLRMGTVGFTAQAFGQRDLKECLLVLQRALLMAFSGGLLIIILQKPILELSFLIIETSSETEYFARQYFSIRIFAAPASIGLFAFTGWFIGMQNAKTPMVVTIVVNALNILFNFLFVFGFAMKSDGVAWGTLIAQYCGLVFAVFFIFRYYKKLFKYKAPEQLLRLDAIKHFFKVNANIFIRMLAVIFVFSFFTTQSAKIGDTVLAVNTLLMQFLMFFSFLADGFAYAGEALVGKYIGAKDRNGLRLSVKWLFVWGIGIACLFTAVYFFAGENILYLLTDNPDIISNAAPYLIFIVVLPVSGFAAYIWDGIFIGATASKAMRNSMLVAAFFVFLPVYYFLFPYIGNHSLWLAMILFMFTRGVYLTFIAKKEVFKQIEPQQHL